MFRRLSFRDFLSFQLFTALKIPILGLLHSCFHLSNGHIVVVRVYDSVEELTDSVYRLLKSGALSGERCVCARLAQDYAYLGSLCSCIDAECVF